MVVHLQPQREVLQALCRLGDCNLGQSAEAAVRYARICGQSEPLTTIEGQIIGSLPCRITCRFLTPWSRAASITSWGD